MYEKVNNCRIFVDIGNVARILRRKAKRCGDSEYHYRKSKEMIIYVEKKLKELESSQKAIYHNKKTNG